MQGFFCFPVNAGCHHSCILASLRRPDSPARTGRINPEAGGQVVRVQAIELQVPPEAHPATGGGECMPGFYHIDISGNYAWKEKHIDYRFKNA